MCGHIAATLKQGSLTANISFTHTIDSECIGVHCARFFHYFVVRAHTHTNMNYCKSSYTKRQYFKGISSTAQQGTAVCSLQRTCSVSRYRTAVVHVSDFHSKPQSQSVHCVTFWQSRSVNNETTAKHQCDPHTVVTFYDQHSTD